MSKNGIKGNFTPKEELISKHVFEMVSIIILVPI